NSALRVPRYENLTDRPSCDVHETLHRIPLTMNAANATVSAVVTDKVPLRYVSPSIACAHDDSSHVTEVIVSFWVPSPSCRAVSVPAMAPRDAAHGVQPTSFA